MLRGCEGWVTIGLITLMCGFVLSSGHGLVCWVSFPGEWELSASRLALEPAQPLIQ
jgi:hypothetical protein